MKTKTIVILEIVVMLSCSVFLVALPAIAADQTTQEVSASANTITTASEDDFVLGVYGNANEDDTIDMRDLTYVKLIFFGKKPETELADAKYDGKINPLDFIQIKLIIVGKEKELTIVDGCDRIVTVKMPVERIIAARTDLETMRSLKVAKDRIAGICKYTKADSVFFPEFTELPSVGSMYSPDYEAILKLNPDVVFLYTGYTSDDVRDKIETLNPNIVVFQFACSKPYELSAEIEKLGYILEKEDEAEKFLGFWHNSAGNIKEMTESLSEDEKPRVYYEYYPDYKTVGTGTGHYSKLDIAGGNNIFSDVSGYVVVDSEAILKRNPEIIVKIIGYGKYKFGGYQQDNIDTSEFKAARDAIMSRPGWGNITAVKNGNVYILHLNIMGGPGQLVGISYLAKWTHPDLFEDMDPKAIHQEYLTEFQGLDYDLGKHGVFVYPEEHPDGK